MIRKIFICYFPVLCILFFAFFAVKPFFDFGFFSMHDNTQVARVFEMGKSLSEGMFPVRWVSDLGYGYGYPIFNFYAPLPYYFGGLFTLFGINALLATKITMVFGIILAGVSMYLLAKEFWKPWGAVSSAVAYIFAMYHAVDIYVRGDVSEFWAYACIPLVFLGLWKAYKKISWKNILIGSFGLAGVILSHNLTAFMVFPFVLIVTILLSLLLFIKGKKLQAGLICVIPILGIMLSSFYIFPVIFEIKYTNVLSQIGGAADFHKNFVCLSQFWYSNWGYGGSVPGCVDGISFMIGKINIIFSIFAFLFLPVLWKQKKEKFFVILFAVFVFLLSLYMATDYSKHIWEVFSTLAFLQYPWRFLILISFSSSFLIGAVVYIIAHLFQNNKFQIALTSIFSLIIISGIIFVQGKYFIPQFTFSFPSNYYTGIQMLRWNTSKISDEYLPKNFSKPKNINEIILNTFNIRDKNIKITQIVDKTNTKSAFISAQQAVNIHFNIAYFPAWKILVDNKVVNYIVKNNGMSISLPKGRHEVKAMFEETPIEKTADFLTLAGIGVAILGIIAERRKKPHAK